MRERKSSLFCAIMRLELENKERKYMNKPMLAMVLLYILAGISAFFAGFLVTLSLGLAILSLFLVVPSVVLYMELKESE